MISRATFTAHRAATIFSLSFALLILAGCSKSDDQLTSEKDRIRTFVEGRTEGVYTNKGNGVYQWIVNTSRPDYSRYQISVPGDSVIFRFDMRLFSSGVGNNTIYTNKPEVIDSLVSQDGLNAQHWNREAMRVKLGATSMVSGLEVGLPGCRTGDSLMVFVPWDQAFGEKEVGTLPEKSSLVYIINVEEVIKQ